MHLPSFKVSNLKPPVTVKALNNAWIMDAWMDPMIAAAIADAVSKCCGIAFFI